MALISEKELVQEADMTHLEYYFSLPLKELRRRQRINALQTVEAYRQKNTIALIRLQRAANLLSEAVYKTQFRKV